MLGVVLCGGQSTRMSSDKGLLKSPFLQQDNTWAQSAVDKISELHLPIIISVNTLQLSNYSAIFTAQQMVFDNELLQIKGPLSGLMSVHLQYPHEDLLILACDMPLMETVLLKELLNFYHQHSAKEAFIFSNEGEPEPLCGIYKATGLAQIFSLYQSARLPKYSMKYMLEHLNTAYLPIAEDKKNCFRNFNAHADLNGL